MGLPGGLSAVTHTRKSSGFRSCTPFFPELLRLALFSVARAKVVMEFLCYEANFL